MKSIQFDRQHRAVGKIVCVGRNYANHIAELNNETPDEAVFFIKPSSAIGEQPIASPSLSIHYECEICFLIVAGAAVAVGLGLDLTDRQKQQQLKQKGLPWERAKAFRQSVCFSPFVAMTGAFTDLSFTLTIDNEMKQQGCVTQMLFKPEQLIEEVETVFGWDDYDILMTGTPAGVGPTQLGQCFIASLFHDRSQRLQHSWQVISQSPSWRAATNPDNRTAQGCVVDGKDAGVSATQEQLPNPTLSGFG